MDGPRPIRRSSSGITLAHLYDAIEAGLSPVHRELSDLRHELRDLAADVTELTQRRGRVRRWVSTNLSTALVNATAGIAIAAAAAAATYLLTHI